MTFTVRINFLYVALALAFVAVVGATWAVTTYTVIQHPDGFLVLNQKKATECGEGGGCGVLSLRELEKLFRSIKGQRGLDT